MNNPSDEKIDEESDTQWISCCGVTSSNKPHVVSIRKKMSEWIKVTDRLPEDDDLVLKPPEEK